VTLLDDDAYLRFLSDGYVVVQPEQLDDQYHQLLWDRADALYQQTRALKSRTAHLEILGDNLRATVPELDRLLADPAVTGAVRSILGTDAFLHPHNFVHESLARDQPFHQDGNLPWNERGHYRSHRPDWLIFFYYPQAVTLDNGPTEIVPSSQFWTTDIERDDGTWRPGDPISGESFVPEVLGGDDLDARDAALAESLDQLLIPDLERRFIEVPAGSVVIGSYDLIHRGSRTLSESAARYMFKFYYARTREPRAPAWSNAHGSPDLDGVRPDLHPIVESNWDWSRGDRRRVDLDHGERRSAVEDLHAGRENEKVAAAYRLGMDTTDDTLDRLIDGLYDEAESTRRAAAYGLRLRCDEAGDALTAACRADRVSVRRFAIFALGAVWSPGATALMERLANESDDLARSNAAYALGQLARASDVDVSALAESLIDRLRPGVEPDNTEVAGLSRSTVRQSAAYAVLQLAHNHALPDDSRAAVTALIGEERDRYVVGMLVEAIARDSPDAGVIRALAARRWSALGGW